MEVLTFDQAKEIGLPVNPFRRRQAVAEHIAAMSRPGVTILPEPFLMGRGDLVRHAVAVETAEETIEAGLYDEVTEVGIGYDPIVGFETRIGMRTRAYIRISKGELENGKDI